MKKVVYFEAGTVADFTVTDEEYADFTGQLKGEVGILDDQLLDTSRQTLVQFMKEGAETVGDMEKSAACFIWYFFNDSGNAQDSVSGDVIIVDQTGEGREIQYASLAAVNLSPGS